MRRHVVHGQIHAGIRVIIFIDDGAAVTTNNTVALLHMDGSNGSTSFTDDTGKTWTANGNAQITTTGPKFGTGAGLFDGTGDYISSSNESAFGFGTGDFCLEAFFNPANLTGNHVICAFDSRWFFYFNSFGGLYVFDANAGVNILSSPTGFIGTGAYQHAAWSRQGSTMRLYLDGSLIQAVTNTENLGASNTLELGRDMRSGGQNYFDGRMDEFRASIVPRYTAATYTVPTGPFTLD